MRETLSSLVCVFVICLSVLSIRAGAAACPELTFGAPTNFAGGLQPNGVASGDMNGDGNIDVISANEGSQTVTLRFGNGAGGFGSSAQFSTITPSAVLIADFNRDGNPDFAVTNRNTGNLTVRLGTGGGAFAPPVLTALGSSPAGIATGDFNRDGNLDLAISNAGGTNVSLLLGNAAGGFPTVTSVSINGAGIWGLAVADFNGDGNPDLATANRGTVNLGVRFGDGLGGFTSSFTYPSGSGPASLVSADFNGDGRPDIAVANVSSNTISVRLNDGTGLFPTASTFASATEPFSLATGDLDNDELTDLVVSNRQTSSVSVFQGNGDGTFDPRLNVPVTSGTRGMSLADLNGDESTDIVAGLDGGGLTVLLNGCVANSEPTIESGTVSRQQDAGSSNSTIATVADDQDDPAELIVNINGGVSASTNGVTVSNLVVGANGAVTADVSASCGASDAMFALDVTDSGGLSAKATLTVEVTNETTAPVINGGDPIADITVYLPLDSTLLSMPVSFDLPAATDNCSESVSVSSSPESGSVFGIGSTLVTVSATDDLDNTSTATFRVIVLFNFSGFLQPIAPLPSLNTANAGSAVPVKFSLSGYKGMEIIVDGYPASSPIPCGDDEPGETVEETISAGGSVLTYDATSDQYKYVWKTSKAWKDTCRIFIVRLSDGSEHYAKFFFR